MATHKLPNGEFHCEWTCPKCGHFQHDSVHVEDGPFISATCGACGTVFEDGHLSDVDFESWENAREAARAEHDAANPPEPTAETRFMASLTEFDRLTERLAELRANHFNADAERISWPDVASLFFVNKQLDEALKHYGIHG